MSPRRPSSPAPGARMTDWAHRKLHFIAIGGAGMSGLALVCDRLGARVSGSDRAESSYLERLRAAGLDARVGHDPDAVPPDAEVVVSTAVGERQPRAGPGARARPAGAPSRRAAGRDLRRAEADRRRRHPRQDDHLRDARPRPARAGRRPRLRARRRAAGCRRGGAVANAGWGAGEWIVAEADESDASFLRLRAGGGRGHQRGARPPLPLGVRGPSCSRPFAASASRPAAWRCPPTGAWPSSPASSGWSASTPSAPGPGSSCRCPGRHNLLNARAALAALELAGFELEAAARALASFPGMLRRLELKGHRDGAPSTTTTRTTRPRWRRPSRRCASSPRVA